MTRNQAIAFTINVTSIYAAVPVETSRVEVDFHSLITSRYFGLEPHISALAADVNQLTERLDSLEAKEANRKFYEDL